MLLHGAGGRDAEEDTKRRRDGDGAGPVVVEGFVAELAEEGEPGGGGAHVGSEGGEERGEAEEEAEVV